MTLSRFVRKNAFRNKRRSLLTLLSISFSLLLLTVMMTIWRAFYMSDGSAESAQRLIVRHKVSLATALPDKYLSRIERMPGVECVMRLTWFGGIYKDERNFFPQFACDADRLFKVFAEAKIDPKQVDDFIKEKSACVVGIDTLTRFGWKIGDKITLQGTIWGCDPELTIRGVYYGTIDNSNMFFHHEYFDELMGKLGLVGMFWIKAENTDVVPGLIQRIDEAFRNTDAETKTETERAFQLSFVSMFGNIKMLVGSICTVIVFTMMLVTASTMSMAIRERARETAILKAIGFDGQQILGLILAESFGLAMAGGVIGCFGAWAIYSRVSSAALVKFSQGMLIKFEVTPHIVAGGLTIAVVLGVVSCVVPAYTSIKATVVEGLKELD